MSTHHSQPRSYEFRVEDRLRMVRERAGYGVRELEAVSGISRATISNYENGRFGPCNCLWGTPR